MRSKAALLAVAGVLLALAAKAQTVEQIIARNLEAGGGMEAIQAVQAVRVTGKASMGGSDAAFTMEWKRPNRARLEFRVGNRIGVQAYDGNTAWKHMQYMGRAEPGPMAADEAAIMAQQADFAGPLVDWESKGHRVVLIGRRQIEGAEVYDLEVTLASGEVVHYLVDAESFLVVKQEVRRKQGGVELELETAFGDYKDVGGLVLPHSMATQLKGAPAGAPIQSIRIDIYDLEAQIDDARFAFPNPAAAPSNR